MFLCIFKSLIFEFFFLLFHLIPLKNCNKFCCKNKAREINYYNINEIRVSRVIDSNINMYKRHESIFF